MTSLTEREYLIFSGTKMKITCRWYNRINRRQYRLYYFEYAHRIGSTYIYWSPIQC